MELGQSKRSEQALVRDATNGGPRLGAWSLRLSPFRALGLCKEYGWTPGWSPQSHLLTNVCDIGKPRGPCSILCVPGVLSLVSWVSFR